MESNTGKKKKKKINPPQINKSKEELPKQVHLDFKREIFSD